MKKIVIALTSFALVSLTACNNAADKVEGSESEGSEETTAVDPGTVEAEGTPVFTFTQESHDFGEINEGDVAEHDFTFKNTGNAPLIITNAQGSCGCTVPQWPREPIAPGEEGLIKVSFNSNGKVGSQTKTVTLNANTVPNTKVLKISALVKGKDGSTEPAQPATQVQGQDANS